MRCYLVAERAAETSILQEVLKSEGVEIVTPERGFAGLTRPGRSSWLPDVDFLCVVFSSQSQSPTPPALYVDIGVAVGSDLPIIVIVEPPRAADSALAPLHVVQVPLSNEPALSFHIKSFFKSMGRARPGPVEQRQMNAETLESFRQELDALSTTEDVSPYSTYRQFEEIVIRLLEAAGALTEEANRRESPGYDIAAWVPGTETVLSGPLLVETKLLARGNHLHRSAFDTLQHVTASRNAPYGLLLYYSLSGQPVRLPSGGWPQVMAFELGDLLKSLEAQSLTRVILNARNALVHGRAFK